MELATKLRFLLGAWPSVVAVGTRLAGRLQWTGAVIRNEAGRDPGHSATLVQTPTLRRSTTPG